MFQCSERIVITKIWGLRDLNGNIAKSWIWGATVELAILGFLLFGHPKRSKNPGVWGLSGLSIPAFEVFDAMKMLSIPRFWGSMN